MSCVSLWETLLKRFWPIKICERVKKTNRETVNVTKGQEVSQVEHDTTLKLFCAPKKFVKRYKQTVSKRGSNLDILWLDILWKLAVPNGCFEKQEFSNFTEYSVWNLISTFVFSCKLFLKFVLLTYFSHIFNCVANHTEKKHGLCEFQSLFTSTWSFLF